MSQGITAEILGLNDEAAWDEIVDRLAAPPYMRFRYHLAYAPQGALPSAFVARDGDKILFYPRFKRKLPEQFIGVIGDKYCDLESVYGYTGPISNAKDCGFVRDSWNIYFHLCRELNVVAEFVRTHPFRLNGKLLPAEFNLFTERRTVFVELPEGLEQAGSVGGTLHRRNVRKARSLGYAVECRNDDWDWNEFLDLYTTTMTRVGARPEYFMTKESLDHLRGLRGIHLVRVAMSADVKAGAMGIFLEDGDGLQYHLGASDEAQLDARVNNLMMQGAAELGISLQKTWLHLGGGLSSAEDDSLFRFKATIGEGRKFFEIGCCVHDVEVYEKLCQTWNTVSGREGGRFCLYYRQ